MELNELGEDAPLFLPFNNEVNKTFFKLKLSPLKPFRQGLAYRAFNNAGTGKANERAGFSKGNIRQHCE